jgi:hypothetical protein
MVMPKTSGILPELAAPRRSQTGGPRLSRPKQPKTEEKGTYREVNDEDLD